MRIFSTQTARSSCGKIQCAFDLPLRVNPTTLVEFLDDNDRLPARAGGLLLEILLRSSLYAQFAA